MTGPRPTVSVVVPFAGTARELSTLLTNLSVLELASDDELIVADNRAVGQSPSALSARIVPARGIRTPASRASAERCRLPATGWCSSTRIRVQPRR
jgi:hypothetical protein